MYPVYRKRKDVIWFLFNKTLVRNVSKFQAFMYKNVLVSVSECLALLNGENVKESGNRIKRGPVKKDSYTKLAYLKQNFRIFHFSKLTASI